MNHEGANIGARGSRLRSHDAVKMIGPGQAPVGETRTIHAAGGQYLSLLGTPGAIFHHPADRWPEWVDLQQVARLATAQAEVARRLADTNPLVT